MAKAVVYDIMGTLYDLPGGNFPFMRMIKEIVTNDFWNSLANWEKNKIKHKLLTTHYESLEELADYLNPCHEADLGEYRDIFNRQIENASAYPEMVYNLIKNRKDSYIGLMSNISSPFLGILQKKMHHWNYSLEEVVDTYCLSCNEGCAKPSSAIFGLMEKKLGIKNTPHITLVDNEINICKSASNRGWKALHVSGGRIKSIYLGYEGN
ncbi:MAG: HAD family hydrolase [Candidatus Nanoarchaeia archaeon]